TFRMRGHEEASGTFYVPDELFEKWEKEDPILRFQGWLRENNLVKDEEQFEDLQNEVDARFTDALNKALEADAPAFNKEKELNAVFTPVEKPDQPSYDNSTSEKRFIDAIQFSLRQAFKEDDNFIIMGQDIAEYGGAFKVTEGFADQFGKERVR